VLTLLTIASCLSSVLDTIDDRMQVRTQSFFVFCQDYSPSTTILQAYGYEILATLVTDVEPVRFMLFVSNVSLADVFVFQHTPGRKCEDCDEQDRRIEANADRC
jgi:hypothetical protein